METGQKYLAKTTKITKTLHHKKLSIQISLSGLSFCILDKHTNTITTLKQVSFDKKLNPFDALNELKDIFSKEQILDQKFSAVLVIHTNDLSSLVPDTLFNEKHLADYLKFNAKILKSDFIAYDKIDSNASVNVYVPYVNINNFIYETFGNFTYKHFSTVLIDTILSLDIKKEIPKIYVHVGVNHFEIVIVNNGALVFYNTFSYTSKEDFIYYVLFTLEQLDLNPEDIPLELLGHVAKDDDIYQISYKYVRHVSVRERQSPYKFSEATPSKASQFIILNSL